MEEYQKRVLIEQQALGIKIVDLTIFLSDYEKVKDLNDQDWGNLNSQLKTMTEYNVILLIRLRNFKEPI